MFLYVEYDNDALRPIQADGAGHSFVLSRPSYGEKDPRAWSASQWIGGSPGVAENMVVSPHDAIKINEFLADPPMGEDEFIEIFNADSSIAPQKSFMKTHLYSLLKCTFLPLAALIPLVNGALAQGAPEIIWSTNLTYNLGTPWVIYLDFSRDGAMLSSCLRRTTE